MNRNQILNKEQKDKDRVKSAVEHANKSKDEKNATIEGHEDFHPPQISPSKQKLSQLY